MKTQLFSIKFARLRQDMLNTKVIATDRSHGCPKFIKSHRQSHNRPSLNIQFGSNHHDKFCFDSSTTSRRQTQAESNLSLSFKCLNQKNPLTRLSITQSIGHDRKQSNSYKGVQNQNNFRDNSLQRPLLVGKGLKKLFSQKPQCNQLSDKKYLHASSKNSREKYQRSSCQKIVNEMKKTLDQFNKRKNQLLTQIKTCRLSLQRRKTPQVIIDMSRLVNLKNPLPNLSLNGQIRSHITNFYQPKQFTNAFMPSKQDTMSDKNFKIIKKIGSGTFSTVYLAIDLKTGFLVTLKKIKRGLLQKQKCKEQLITQIKIQMFIDHPNVLKIYGLYADAEHVTLILEFMEGGNLYKKLCTKKEFSEYSTGQAISQTLFALQCLHQHRVVHRDIKPQNIVISHNVHKICDFGTAAICKERRSTACGTLDYNAPQVIQGEEYDVALDMWSVGILTYELLTGKPPFYHLQKKDTIKQIAQYRDGEINYPKHISLSTINFIAKFLLKNPENRISIEKALSHKFILQNADPQTRQLRQKYQKQVNSNRSNVNENVQHEKIQNG